MNEENSHLQERLKQIESQVYLLFKHSLHLDSWFKSLNIFSLPSLNLFCTSVSIRITSILLNVVYTIFNYITQC